MIFSFRPPFKAALKLSAATTLCLHALPSAAEEAATDQRIEEIIVTSGKLNRTLKDTVSSAIVYTGESLENRSVEDIYDVVLRTPNVSQSFGEKGFSIRGIDQRAGAGAGLLVNVIVDGASLPNNQATFFGPYSAWDVGQVEILRGPQGTTQGRNAIGGTIVINSADPVLDEFSGKARASYGELNSYQLAAALNVPIITDELGLRLSVDKRETDGWVDNPTRDEDYDKRDALTARAKLLWQPTDRFSAKYTFSYTDSTGGEDNIDFERFPQERVNLSDGDALEGSKHYINTLQLDYDLTDTLSVTSISTLYKHDYVRIEDFDATATPLSTLNRWQDDDNFAQEIRFNYNAGGRIRGVFGGYYGTFDNTTTDNFSLPLALVVDPATLVALGIDPAAPIFQERDIRNEEENIAMFGEVEFDVTSRLTLIVGARYDDESRDSYASSVTSVDPSVTLPFPLPSDEPTNTEASYNAFLPKFAVRYDVGEDTVFGLSAQKAYRAGGVSTSTVSGTTTEFDPETAWTYEAALRTSFDDNRFIVDANVFYTKWTDQIVSRVTDFGIANGVATDTVGDNAGKSRLYGFEMQALARWTEEFSTFANIGFVDTEFTQYETATAEFEGNEFAYAPGTSFSVGFDYNHASGFVARADANWTDDSYSVTDNDPLRTETLLSTNGLEIEACTAEPCNDPATILDDRLIVNAKLGYQAERWSVFLFARNLFDEDYVTQVQPFALNAVTGEVGRIARGGEPRVVGVEFNFKFGE